MAPALTAARFGLGLLLGAGLGLVYGFLTPLRPRWTGLADGIFVLALLWGWLVLSFGVCRGDVRLSYTVSLFLGVWAFHRTAGRLLMPLFRGFWRGIGAIFRGIVYPARKFFKKIRENLKKVFASLKKRGTI